MEAKAGKPRHVILTDEGAAAVRGADGGDDPIFTRADGGTWGKSHQSRPMLEACQRAKIKRAISFHVLRHTHGSALAVRGVPMGVIAEQLGHADTGMTERHYAHLSAGLSLTRSARISQHSELATTQPSHRSAAGNKQQ